MLTADSFLPSLFFTSCSYINRSCLEHLLANLFLSFCVTFLTSIVIVIIFVLLHPCNAGTQGPLNLAAKLKFLLFLSRSSCLSYHLYRNSQPLTLRPLLLVHEHQPFQPLLVHPGPIHSLLVEVKGMHVTCQLPVRAGPCPTGRVGCLTLGPRHTVGLQLQLLPSP